MTQLYTIQNIICVTICPAASDNLIINEAAPENNLQILSQPLACNNVDGPLNVVHSAGQDYADSQNIRLILDDIFYKNIRGDIYTQVNDLEA